MLTSKYPHKTDCGRNQVNYQLPLLNLDYFFINTKPVSKSYKVI